MRRRALQLLTVACFGLLVVLAMSTLPSAGAPADDETPVSVYTTDNASFDSAEDVEAAITAGTLRQRTQVVIGEAAIIAVDYQPLADDLANRDGPTTDRFFDTLDGNTTFRLFDSQGPNQAGLSLDLGPENTTVFRTESTVYVTIDTGEVSSAYLQDVDAPAPELDRYQRYILEFVYEDEEVWSGEAISFNDRKAELDEPYIQSPPSVLAPEVTEVPVTVHVPPRDDVAVRLNLADGQILTSPLNFPEPPMPTFDLRDVEPGTNYTLELVYDGSVLERQNGTVRELDASFRNLNATVAGDPDVDVWLNMTATLSHGGRVDIYDATGSRIGFKWVDPGTTNVSVPLPNTLRDWGSYPPSELEIRPARKEVDTVYPYPVENTVVDVDHLDWGGATTTGTPTPAPTATETPARTQDSTPTDTPPTTPSPDDADDADSLGPGFTVGIGIVSLLALLGAGIRASRRSN